MAFQASQLSQENVLRDVHDSSTQSLRVSAFAIPPPGGLEVIITDADDSIKIGNGSGQYMAVNPDGSINVVLTSSGLTTKNLFNEITSVPAAVTSNILSYVAVANTKLLKVDVGGTNIAAFEVLINGSLAAKKYTYFQNLNEIFDFKDGLPVVTGQVILIRVTHNRPDLGDFNANVLVEN